MLFQIKAPHFTAGIEPGKEAAPIIKYMQHWTVPQIVQYCKKKGWTVIELKARESLTR